jgi:choline dehydrogenase
MLTTPAARDPAAEYDFIIVGSGAGGGPLACNLARRQFRVLLIEAGSKETSDYSEIPAMYTRAAEDKAISWEYFVRHYADKARSKRDSKWCNNVKREKQGIFYPRASGLGGCTVHNAMITMSGPADDWDAIASLVDDGSWNSERMRRYFERLENCHYIRPGYVAPNPLYDLVAKFRGNRGRHGFDGWLDTAWANPWLILKDRQLVFSLVAAFLAARKAGMASFFSLLWGFLTGTLAAQLDPNHWERMRKRPEGLALVPMAVRDGRRRSVRDYLLETERTFPKHLTIWTDTLVTEVLLRDGRDGTKEAYGVRFQEGVALYKAHKWPRPIDGAEGRVFAKREVILAAGAFNTPQLLMLSGIGPGAELTRHGIPVLVNRPGVGRNLQDRYEVSVIWEMPTDFSLLAGLKFDITNPPDRAYERWTKTHDGLYATNGVLMALMKKSRPNVLLPDLCIFALPGKFKGFKPGFSNEVVADTKHLTWLILKAHTKNRGGTVRLRSRDPRETPAINFSYFNEGSDVERDDLDALVEGIKFVRQMTFGRPCGTKEVWPGDAYKSDAELREWVASEAWGHHASCTCPMGPEADPMSVLDESFRVHGTRNLRVVDASAFPLIPGVFIAANIYMLAERAAEVIGNAYAP